MPRKIWDIGDDFPAPFRIKPAHLIVCLIVIVTVALFSIGGA